MSFKNFVMNNTNKKIEKTSEIIKTNLHDPLNPYMDEAQVKRYSFGTKVPSSRE